MPPIASDVKVYLLGDFRVEYLTQPVKLPTKQTKMVLAYLALERDQPVRREKLASLFWGRHAFEESRDRDNDDDDDHAVNLEKTVRASLRTALSSIRKALGHDIFVDDMETVQLNPARSVWIDAVEFKNQVERFAESPNDAGLLQLELYKGDMLPEFEDDPDEPWILPMRASLRDLYRDALLHAARRMRAIGEYDNAIAHAQKVLDLEASNEEACQHLMFSYFMQGHKNLALDQYRKLERALQNEFGEPEYAEPSSETKLLFNRIKQAKSRTVAAVAALTNLPNLLTHFIGREQETEQLKRLLLSAARLVTLTGAGGCGKTRLAIHVALDALEHYGEGVWWIELESLAREDALVPQAVAKVLGVREHSDRDLTQVLSEHLRMKQTLLVLDNCEHLLMACAKLCEQLLSACPHLQILTTSREILRVAGEHSFSVAPLTIPPEKNAATVESAKQFESVQFFLDRASIEKSNFALNEGNTPSVIQICRRLDGIPLAIELAAARLKTLSVEYIASHLNERFALLSKGPRTLPRHQTLRAAIDWSYDLLEPAEQRLLNELGVFAGWFTLEAVEQVHTQDDGQIQVREMLESLTDKSLVVLEIQSSGEARYRLLDTIRQYAREKLQVSKQLADAAFARMGKYYLDFAKQHQKDYVTLEQEWDNVSAGMRVMHRQKMWEEVIGYGHALTETGFARGFYSEARRIYPMVCQAAEELEEQEAYITSMLNWARAYIEQGFYPEAEEILTRLLRICREAADQSGIAGAQLHLARLEIERSNYDHARELLEECQSIRERLDDQAGLAEIMLAQSRIEYRFFRYDEAERLALQAFDILKTFPVTPQSIVALKRLALFARMKKDYDRAEQYCREAILFCEQLQDRGELGSTLFVLAQLRKARGDLQSAREYSEQSRDLMRIIGAPKSEAYVLDFLGWVYADLESYESAYRTGKQSLDLLRELHDDTGVVYACLHLGKTLRKMNRLSEACQLWAEALPTADKLKLPNAEELRALLDQHCAKSVA
ncbi:MAG: tetratricopeptide repeat protein [Chloroflexi bacterium]|nr:tetratricopeptide repeat protein [Chloroflexota bacterium]